MGSLLRKFVLACAASASLVLAFAGGLYVFEDILGAPPACPGEGCAAEQASIIVPSQIPAARPEPPPAASRPPSRIAAVDRDISAAAPRRIVPVPGRAEPLRLAAPDPRPDLPRTPGVVEYALGLTEAVAAPDGDEIPDAGGLAGALPADLVRGVESILANSDARDAAALADDEPEEPDPLIARPLGGAFEPEPAETGIDLPSPPVPVGRPMMLLPQDGSGRSDGSRGGAGVSDGASRGSSGGGGGSLGGGAVSAAGGALNAALGN